MSLFELRITALVPAIGAGRDIAANAIAEDGFDYALKRQQEHPLLPATEWFCYRIAQAVGLACPAQAVLIMPDGARVLGSRIEAGLTDLQKKPQDEVIHALAACAGRLSAAYSMDLFLANEDRHFGNFLFRPNSLGALACMPIDYSRAWWVCGWPPPNLALQACATTNHMAILRAVALWRAPEALLALGSISQIKPATVSSWLDDMPDQWLDAAMRNTLLQWWESPAFQLRLSQCVAYCKQP